MHRVAITFLTFAFVTVAGVPAADAQRERPSEKLLAVAPATEVKGAKLHGCFDGECTITVSEPVSFRISSRYGFRKLSIMREGGGLVRVRGTGRAVSSEVLLSAGATGTLNNISIRVVSITESMATLRLAPAR